ncbi:tyrosine-type recombinase/integrase [Undibacterium sp. FT147W]|uniref:Tyrosine-type recombinase/integrase n=1 Tax=Undibacterium rivi TaxID=2828729 RepID=A0ABS5H0D7_9BURK|nr:tyrosine-type recombinase/integrase [Undibacterium rivi]MBR7792175.1 tyrosine-type recombinase/integrase [Undibacterium rivi]
MNSLPKPSQLKNETSEPGSNKRGTLAEGSQNGVLAASAQQIAAFLAAATSDNTRRAYRSAIRHFLEWGGLLPADEASLIRYMAEHAGKLNPRTLSLRLTALSQWHKHQGFPDPCSYPNVRKILTGITRVHAKPKKKARALVIEELERIVLYLSEQSDIKAIRDSALLQIAFFGGFRRSELVGLRCEDVKWESEGITLLLPRSKTDQAGEGIAKAIPYGDSSCCPATALKRWLSISGVYTGAIFRRIDQWKHVGEQALHANSVNKILTECAAAAGLDYVPEFSSHSLRRGMATSAYRAGASFRDIKRQGGWRFDGTVQGYIEDADQFKENAMHSLLRQKK